MAFVAGTKLGTYEIVGPLGKGGMGEVYRARDSRLKREVAIKVLPDEFCRDADRVSRFQREAEVLASLNHPHIAAIHHLEEYEKSRLLVLELVEGETLADRIPRGPVPVDEAVEIAKQIAEALEAAHEKGIVHRDLKPANIKITPEGKVKVLDFGLAKMYEAESSAENLSQSPTLMSARTGGSVILGTVSYMSPEQARGRPVTKQTDIWAFGCVLFEMLTGHMAFSGETVSDTIAKILKDEPDWNAVPELLRRIVGRCLQKDLLRRFHDAGDIRFDLEEALNAPIRVTPTGSSRRRYLVLIAGLLLISILIGSGLWVRSGIGNRVPAWTGTLLGGPTIAYGPRASPDGKMLAFQALLDGQSQLAVMNPKSGNWTVLTHDKNAGWTQQISWSPDGTKIYFDRAAGQPLGVFSIPALGGEPRLLLENAGFPDALPDGSLLVVRQNSGVARLYRFRPDTKELQALNALLPYSTALLPVALFRAFPDGRQVVFFGKPAESSSDIAALRLHILDLQSNTSRSIGPELKPGVVLSGLAVNPIDGSILINEKNGDLNQILSIPMNGTDPGRVLITLTGEGEFIDMAADGSLYVDQIARPLQALRFTDSAEVPEALATMPSCLTDRSVLELPDRSFLLSTFFDGHSRLLAAKPGGEIAPFFDTDEETSGPITFAGPNQVAFMLGKAPEQSIAIVSIKDGRLIERLNIAATGVIRSLSASSDGTMLFYADAGAIWSISTAGGEARKIGPGDSVAFDPQQGDLIVAVNDKDIARLTRMSISSGPPRSIPIRGELRLPQDQTLGQNAVGKDGQIVIGAGFRDSWFLRPVILDPNSGNFRRTPFRYDADLLSLSWNQKNEIITAGCLMRSTIWRFRPESRN